MYNHVSLLNIVCVNRQRTHANFRSIWWSGSGTSYSSFLAQPESAADLSSTTAAKSDSGLWRWRCTGTYLCTSADSAAFPNWIEAILNEPLKGDFTNYLLGFIDNYLKISNAMMNTHLASLVNSLCSLNRMRILANILDKMCSLLFKSKF